MGILCENLTRGRLDADLILQNINKLFQGMIIRSIGIDTVKEALRAQLASGQITDIQSWQKLLMDDIYNSEYGQTSRELVNEAMQDAQANYGDATLPFLSLLLFANSDRETFVKAFKAINLLKKGQGTINNVQNVINAGRQGGILAGIASGFNAIKNIQGTIQQVANPSMVKRQELKTMMAYHINFLTLLPVNLLAKHNEGVPMKGYFVTVLNNAFNKSVQSQYVEQTLFKNYNNQEDINVEQFFGDHYLTLKNDNGLRKGLVNNYINNLNPTDVVKLLAGE